MMKKITIFLVLLLLVGCSNTNNNENNDEIKKLSVKEQIGQLVENAYLYSKYSIGEIEVSDGYTEIGGKKYYLIEDEIGSFDELNKLIEDTFVDAYYITYYEELYKNKNIIMLDDKFFTDNKDACNIDDMIELDDITIEEQTEKYVIFSIDYSSYYAFLEEDGYRLNTSIFKCIE